MAHFAELDETNTVVSVLVIHNDVITVDGVEDEQRGIDFLDDAYPDSGTWVQTSYNQTIRYNYAGPGYTWDGTGFAPPQPYPSWSLDGNYLWQPPTPIPDDGKFYVWDESTTSWVTPPSPFPSWTLNGDNEWEPPVAYPGVPTEAPYYRWDEDTTSWVGGG